MSRCLAKRTVTDRHAWHKATIAAWNRSHPHQPLPAPPAPDAQGAIHLPDPALEQENAQVLAQAATFAPCRPGVVAVYDPSDRSITITPIRCKKWVCPRCGPILAHIWSKRIADAKPQRMLTLTCDHTRFPNPQTAYEAMKAALPRLVRLLRARIGPFEYAAVWELHEDRYPHLHIAMRGHYVPQKWLSLAWDHLGLGPVVDIRQVKTRKGAAHYMAKYMCKTVAAGKAGVCLTRVIQASRRFFEHTVFSVKTYVPPGGLSQRCPRQAYDVIRFLVTHKAYTPDLSKPGPPWRFVPTHPPRHYGPPEGLLADLSRQ